VTTMVRFSWSLSWTLLISTVLLIASGKYEIDKTYHQVLNSSSQNEYIEEHIKRHGRRLDYYERKSVHLAWNEFRC
jgi:hypothetical protein